MEKEEEDRRREAAMSSTLCLQPNFNPKGVTTDQLSKFRELHRRRLQLKSKSKFKTKSKDVANKKSLGNDQCSQNSGVQVLKADNKEISLGNSCGNLDLRNEESEGGVSVLSASKKKKLHWGISINDKNCRKLNWTLCCVASAAEKTRVIDEKKWRDGEEKEREVVEELQ